MVDIDRGAEFKVIRNYCVFGDVRRESVSRSVELHEGELAFIVGEKEQVASGVVFNAGAEACALLRAAPERQDVVFELS